MRNKGKITSWNETRGFGFITPNSSEKQIFVHIKAFSDRKKTPEIAQTVTYVTSTDKQGRPCAVDAVLSGWGISQISQINWKDISIPVLIGALCLIVIGLSIYSTNITPYILGLYLVLSLVTFIIYAFDKSAAKRGAWRTKETTLHLLSLAGGWPGALIAQQVLRHKSQKQPFRLIFWITVLLNCGAFAWLFMPSSAAILEAFEGKLL